MVPLASHEVRWFFEGKSTDHASLRRWFETTDPLSKDATIGAPVWKGRLNDQPDAYLLVPSGADMGIKWREGELQIKGRVSDLGIHVFCDRHRGQVERWMKWSYAGLPDSHKGLFVRRKAAGPAMVEVKKTRALRKIRLDTMTAAAQEVDAKTFVDRGLGVELTDLEVGGRPYCSLAFEAFPDDSAMSGAFNLAVTAFLEGLKGIDLDPARSESYPRWLGRLVT